MKVILEGFDGFQKIVDIDDDLAAYEIRLPVFKRPGGSYRDTDAACTERRFFRQFQLVPGIHFMLYKEA